MQKNKLILPIILIIVAISAVFCALVVKIGFGVTLKLFSSFLLVFFVPGMIWSFAILGEGKQISPILRLVFAFAFSILSVPLIEFYSNHLFKIVINRTNILFEITIFSFVGLVIYFIRYFKRGFRKFILILALSTFIFSPLNAGATVLPFDNSSLKIVKVSGDKQVINIGQGSEEVKTKVVDENNNPISGVEVIFTLYDEKGNIIGSAYSTISDHDGFATFKPKISNAGKYKVKAELDNGSNVVFDLNIISSSKGINPLWLLLLIIPLAIIPFLIFRPQKHQVYNIDNQEGIVGASIIIQIKDNSKNLTSNEEGYFIFRFKKIKYQIIIEKNGYVLESLDNHSEFAKTDNKWFFFNLSKRNEKLRFGMKPIAARDVTSHSL